MRIKWTSLHSVIETNSTAPWVGPGLAERLKREALSEKTKTENKKTTTATATASKSDRALAWFRRSR